MSELVKKHWPFADPTSPIPFSLTRSHLSPVQANLSKIVSGPAYHIPESAGSPSNVVILSHDNVQKLCADTYPTVHEDVDDEYPCVAKVVDGKAVSMCTTVRRSPRAAEAGVETLDAYRGNGFARDVTNAWAKTILAEGRTALYSTFWDNQASQRVAEKLGAVQYASDFRLS